MAIGTTTEPGTVSRRALLGLGLRRAVDGRRAELEAVAAEARAAPRRPGWWDRGDPARLAPHLAPAAGTLGVACEATAGMQVLELTAGTALLSHTPLTSHSVVASSRLPFEHATFDCAASAFGAVHTPNPRRLTAELNRVVRPGGAIAIAAWTPTGFMGRALTHAARVLGRSSARTAARWGRYEDAYRRFGFHPGFEIREQELVMQFADASEAVDALLETPGPLFAEGDGRAALEPGLLELIEEHRTPDRERCAVRCEYVLILARTPHG